MLRAVKTIRVQVCKTTKTYRDGWTRSIWSVIYSSETYTTFCVYRSLGPIGYYPTFFWGSSLFSSISSFPKRCNWKKDKTLTARRAGIRSRSERSFFFFTLFGRSKYSEYCHHTSRTRHVYAAHALLVVLFCTQRLNIIT